MGYTGTHEEEFHRLVSIQDRVQSLRKQLKELKQAENNFLNLDPAKETSPSPEDVLGSENNK